MIDYNWMTWSQKVIDIAKSNYGIDLESGDISSNDFTVHEFHDIYETGKTPQEAAQYIVALLAERMKA